MKKPTKNKMIEVSPVVKDLQPGKSVIVQKNDIEKKKDSLSIENLLSQAVNSGVPVETLERLLAMRRELKAEKAKEEFDQAMADFQNECPTIKKTKEVKLKDKITVAYRYAPIESIVEQVKPYLQKFGFSYSTQMVNTPDRIKAICIVKHIGGHSESYEMEVPLGSKTDVMSNSQVTAAASTFAKRYAFCNAFGILTGDEDNDGGKLPDDKNEDEKPVDPNIDDQAKLKKALEIIDTSTTEQELVGIIKSITASKNYSQEKKTELIKACNDKIEYLSKKLDVNKSMGGDLPTINVGDEG